MVGAAFVEFCQQAWLFELSLRDYSRMCRNYNLNSWVTRTPPVEGKSFRNLYVYDERRTRKSFCFHS